MTEITLEALGLSKEKLIERLLDHLSDQILTETFTDSDGYPDYGDSPLARKLKARVQKQIDAAVAAIGDEHVMPQITKMVEDVCLQQTNEWGEKRGEPLTFTEYLVQRADAYLREEVDYDGRARGENRYSSSWSKKGTRIVYLIDKHFQYHIEKAMREAYENADKTIKGGIQKAVEQALQKIKVQLSTKVTDS
jgi:hypothetical protein